MTGPVQVRCMLMRGGTSVRDDLLLRIMGSPDPLQIDGLGGAHPLTGKVAVVSLSADPKADVDYLFLQVGVDSAEVSDRQNRGNLLAGVGPFAVERGLVQATRTFIPVRCHTSIGVLGVLGAASVAAGLRIDGSVGAPIADLPSQGDRHRIEHPTGFTDRMPSRPPSSARTSGGQR
jgi:4-oxalomesaconate tautomerase